MITHELLNAVHFLPIGEIQEDGRVEIIIKRFVNGVDAPTDELETVFRQSAIAPEFFNLVRSSALMYQQLTAQFNYLESLLALADAAEADEAFKRQIGLAQNGILLAQQAAREGIEAVARMLRKGHGT